MRSNTETEKVIGIVLMSMSGNRLLLKSDFWLRDMYFNQGQSPSELPLNQLECKDRQIHTHTHTHPHPHTQTHTHTPHLRMRPNAGNLDNLKHDKEQDDKKTIKRVSEWVRDGTSGGCKNRRGYSFMEQAGNCTLLEDWLVNSGTCFLRTNDAMCFNYTDRWAQYDRPTKQHWEGEGVMSPLCIRLDLSGDLIWVRSLTFTQTGWKTEGAPHQKHDSNGHLDQQTQKLLGDPLKCFSYCCSRSQHPLVGLSGKTSINMAALSKRTQGNQGYKHTILR